MKTKFACNSKSACLGALLAIVAAAPAAADSSSLWVSSRGREANMFSDRRARHLGDILTVIVQESASVQASRRTKTDRASSVDNAVTSFLFAPPASNFGTLNGALPSSKWGGSNSFDGGGEINNRQTVTARAAVTVVDVLPNGNLVIEGARYVAYAGEKQHAVLRGIVRPDDIQSGNTVLSSSIADARVEFLSDGAITAAQKKGWFTRVFDTINPF